MGEVVVNGVASELHLHFAAPPASRTAVVIGMFFLVMGLDENGPMGAQASHHLAAKPPMRPVD